MQLPNLSNYSISELEELVNLAKNEIDTRKKAEQESTKKQILELAQKAGLNLADIFGEPVKPKQVRRPAEVKYIHPDNKTLTWTGRGRKPAWLEEFLKNGGTIEQCMI